MINLNESKKELIEWQQIEAGATFEIGRILKTVRDSEIERGEWTRWVESVGYNPRTAQRYIQIYERFNGIPQAEGIPISKLTELLSLPIETDPTSLLSEAKTATKKVVRERVKEFKGKANPSPATEQKAKRSRKQSSSSKIKSAVEALQNLTEFFTEEIESDRVGYDQAIEIGKLTEWQQGIMQNVYETEEVDNIELLTSLCSREGNIDVIKQIMYKVSVILLKSHHIKASTEGYELFVKLYEMDETVNYEELKSLVNEIYSRLDEFEQEYSRQKEQGSKGRYEWDDFFSGSNTQKVNAENGSPMKILDLSENVTPAETKKRYRHLVKILHPDVGGSAYLFDMVIKAYDELKE
ncbi:DUF3102 domain-containing protein [Aquibacillus saliphilus]|uniref:DUF3102 domain-containing protein n=1 Tax=Aquibacillus saliphilus TaxID=1909422 RepID=UPI001CF05194|nr:DUF3102 domain-containing protein [Aquibacillus saliphilus]